MSLERPTLAEFVRHAELFGTECVYGTAEAYLAERELRRLRIELDTIEAGRRTGRYSVGRRRRRTRAETQVAIELLLADGLTRREVAAKLGLSDRTVDFYLTPKERRMTPDLPKAFRRRKAPANEGVEMGGLRPPELGSTMRCDETGQMTLGETA
jgi:hypothetical protein